ncbi:MAG: LysR family transcriptional regulator [Burkholderiales bacterium]|nr:LysR family transcriptional regulator [Burkholderiales bacterium]MDE1927993.1 LysR family transcriptional regulator [Burkholderiales bacterium]MDE2157653.1 LysR family transcriptional regulator [Burkholderiales bacterium]MDE2503526.1 LysR family transcriptional regulator [Burkholderiales bacterium]
MHFDLTDLRLMVHIAEADSLTRGAAAAHLSLPAASTRIKHLEASLGLRLFYRNRQGVTLTTPGQDFVRHARLVLAQIENLAGEMQEYAKGVKGHLRVYANTTALGEFLPPVLHRYLLDHPDVSIDLRERLSDDIVRAVAEGQTDIGIVAGHVRTESLEVIPYRSDRLVLVVPAGHALADAAAVAFEDTLHLDHIGLHEASAIHAFLRQASAGLHRALRLRIQVGNFEAACRMVDAGVGVGVMPESAARRHARTLAIRIVALSDAWSLRALQICLRRLDALPGFARDLVELLVADARAPSRP